jgi:hypothetical protein
VINTSNSHGDARLMDQNVWRAFAERFAKTWQAAVLATRETAEQELNDASD